MLFETLISFLNFLSSSISPSIPKNMKPFILIASWSVTLCLALPTIVPRDPPVANTREHLGTFGGGAIAGAGIVGAAGYVHFQNKINKLKKHHAADAQRIASESAKVTEIRSYNRGWTNGDLYRLASEKARSTAAGDGKRIVPDEQMTHDDDWLHQILLSCWEKKVRLSYDVLLFMIARMRERTKGLLSTED